MDQISWKRKRSWSRCIVSPGCRLQSHGHLRTGDRLSLGTHSKQRRFRRRCHTVLTAFSPVGDHLRALSVRRSLSQPARASEEISFARQTGLVCEVLQAASVRYCRSPPTPDAAPANKPAHGGARRHAGPCQHWSQPTNSVGRRQKIIKIIINQRRATTSSTPTLYHSCLGSYFQQLIFAHCPHQLRPPTRRNFLRKSDCLSLRRIAGTECDILPIPINYWSRDVGQWISSVTWREPVICFATVTFTSANAAPVFHAHSVLAQETAASAFFCRAGQTVGSGHAGGTSTCASTAYPSCPVVAQHERKRHHPRGNGRLTGPGELATFTLARTFRHRLSAVANSAFRDGTSFQSEVTTAVRIHQHSGVRRSPNHNTITHSALSSPLFQRFCVLTHTRSMAAAHDKRTDDWASPTHFHRCAH